MSQVNRALSIFLLLSAASLSELAIAGPVMLQGAAHRFYKNAVECSQIEEASRDTALGDKCRRHNQEGFEKIVQLANDTSINDIYWALCHDSICGSSSCDFESYARCVIYAKHRCPKVIGNTSGVEACYAPLQKGYWMLDKDNQVLKPGELRPASATEIECAKRYAGTSSYAPCLRNGDAPAN